MLLKLKIFRKKNLPYCPAPNQCAPVSVVSAVSLTPASLLEVIWSPKEHWQCLETFFGWGSEMDEIQQAFSRVETRIILNILKCILGLLNLGFSLSLQVPDHSCLPFFVFLLTASSSACDRLSCLFLTRKCVFHEALWPVWLTFVSPASRTTPSP